MPSPFLSTMMKSLVYPAALTVLNLCGNAYILGNQVEDVRQDLGGRIDSIDKKVALLTQRQDHLELKDMAIAEVALLTQRQDHLEMKDMAIAENWLKDCANGKR